MVKNATTLTEIFKKITIKVEINHIGLPLKLSFEENQWIYERGGEKAKRAHLWHLRQTRRYEYQEKLSNAHFSQASGCVFQRSVIQGHIFLCMELDDAPISLDPAMIPGQQVVELWSKSFPFKFLYPNRS